LAPQCNGNRGDTGAAALASSFNDIIGDNAPDLADTVRIGRWRGGHNNAVAAPIIATD